VAILFVFGIGFFIVHFAINTTVSQMTNMTQINGSAAAVTSFEGVQETTNRLDYLIFGLFVGLTLALIIASWFVGGHPIFMVVYFLVIVIAVVTGAVLSNVWQDVSIASVFGSTVDSFPITNHLLTYLPIYAAVIGIIGIIVMFAKPYLQEGY